MANTVSLLFEVDRDSSGRTVLRQINRDINHIGQTAQQTGAQVDGALQLFKSAIIVEFFRRGTREAVAFGQESVRAFNEAKAAALGLESQAIFKGFSGTEARERVRDIKAVRDGLLSLGDASQTVKNFLKTGFSLDQAIDLTNRFADAAAFGKSASLSFGDAVRSGSEGVATQSSQLLNNVGIVTNLSTILERAGLTLDDLTSKTKGSTAVQVLYKGLMNETADAAGNAAKLTNTYAGAQARLEAIEGRLLVTVGELITKNPELGRGIEQVAHAIEEFTKEAATPGSEVNRTLNDFISLSGKAVQTGAELISFVKDYAGELGALAKVLAVVGGVSAFQGLGTLASLPGNLNTFLKGGGAAGGAVAGADPAAIAEALSGFKSARGQLAVAERRAAGAKDILDQARLNEKVDQSRESYDKAKEALNTLTDAAKETAKEASGLGDKLKNFATGGVRSGFALGAGLVGSIGSVIAEAITGAIREASEKRLSVAESTANLGIGGNKDLAQRQKELDTLQSILNSGDVGKATGGTFDIPALSQRIAQTERLIGLQKELEGVNKTITSLEAKRAEGASLNKTEATLRESSRFKDLKDLETQAKRTSDEFQRLTGTDVGSAIAKRIQGIVVPGADLSAAVIAREKDIRKSQDDLLQGTIADITELKKQLTDNPFIAAYDAAEKRGVLFTAKTEDLLDKVKAKMKEVPDELIRAVGKSQAEFEKLNQSILSLDVFKANLAKTDRLESLLEEQEKLRAGLGGQANRDRFTDRDAQRAAIISEIEQKRGAGTLSREEHHALLNRLNALDNISPLERLEREFAGRRIASDQAALAQAGNDPLKQSLALDRLLQHTADIGKLTGEQADLRADALRRRIEIENAAQEKKASQEAERLATDKEMIPALKDFTMALLKGLGIDVNVTDTSTQTDLGTSPGADSLLGSASSFARGPINNF